jgi:Domain of unknown function (DUF4365)
MSDSETPKLGSSPSPRPAGYASTDSAEIGALNLFRTAIDVDRVKVDLKERDRHPNIDGYVELVDDSHVSLGKLEVQVKKIPPGMRRYQCRTSLFAYTKTTSLPVLLICVDTTKTVVYWKHLKYDDILGKESQDSISVSFEVPEDVISHGGSYYNRWLSISRNYCDRIRRAEALQEIADKATPLIGYSSQEIRQIQIFLDELNRLLDGSYGCIKRSFFPGVWKIGFAVQNWTDQRIQYRLFSIDEGKNDPLIKQIDPALGMFSNPDIGVYSYLGPNPLAQNPKEAAHEFIFDRMKDIIRENGLSIRTDFLAREFLFDFIDTHRQCLGLEKKDEYEGIEIYHAFHEYLPRWCDAARRTISYPSHIPYFDPTIAQMMMGKSNFEEVDLAVKSKLPFSSLYIGSSQVSYSQLYDLAEFVRSTGRSVERLYRRSTVPRIGPWSWSGYKDEECMLDLQVIFENFTDVYRSFVNLNGMDYAALKPFSSDSSFLVFYTPPKMSHSPRIKKYQLVSTDEPVEELFVRVLRDPGIAIKRDSSGNSMVFEGKTYPVKWLGDGDASFVFQRTPMLTLVYETLEQQIAAVLGRKAKIQPKR